MQTGIAKHCFTTNFDTAIEHAARGAIGVYLHQDGPRDLDHIRESNARLVKLHGDITGTCVATFPELYKGRNSYEYLRPLLTNQKVLVLGYSGNGDIDIFSHLAAAAQEGAQFIWNAWGSKPPGFASYYTAYDLRAAEWTSNVGSCKENWLLGLASRHGWVFKDSSASPDWKRALVEWLDDNNVPFDRVKEIVGDIFTEVAHRPILHLFLVQKGFPISTTEDKLRLCQLYLGMAVADYVSAQKILEQIDPETLEAGSEQDILFNMWWGFIYWRTGKWRRALQALKPYVTQPVRAAHTFHDDNLIPEAQRIYLCTARDQLRRMRACERQKFVTQWKLDHVVDKLRKDSEQQRLAARSDSLDEFVFCDLDHLRGRSVDTDRLYGLFHLAVNSQAWAIAEEAARSLVVIFPPLGRRAMAELNANEGGIRWYLYNINIPRKRWAALLYAHTPRRHPFLIDLLDGPIGKRLVLTYSRLKTLRKERQWRKAYRRDTVVTV